MASLNHWVTSQDDNAINHFHYYKPLFLFIILLWFHHQAVRVNEIVNWLLVWILWHCWINYNPPVAGTGRFSAHNSAASHPELSDSSHLPHTRKRNIHLYWTASETLTHVTVTDVVVWDVTPYSLVGTGCLHLQGRIYYIFRYSIWRLLKRFPYRILQAIITFLTTATLPFIFTLVP